MVIINHTFLTITLIAAQGERTCMLSNILKITIILILYISITIILLSLFITHLDSDTVVIMK